MEWRKADIVDFYETGIQVVVEGQSSDGWGGTFAHSIRVEGWVLSKLCRALDIPFRGEIYRDEKGKSHESLPDFYATIGDDYDGNWKVAELWAYVEASGLIHVKARYEGNDQLEEFTFSGKFVVHWSSDEGENATV